MNNIYTAEELAEDTFFRLVTKKPRFVETYSFKTWLYTIGRNIAFNHVKHFGKVTNVSFEDMERMQSDVDLLEQSSNEQIATVMKKNKRQIENRIYQAKQSLKSELDKEGFHYEGL